MHSMVLLLGISASFLYSGTFGETPCPPVCKCLDHGEVKCTGHKKNLDYIPPLPEKTKILTFSGNWLPNVDKETFANISNLRLTELVFGGNHIKNISRDAFEIFTLLHFLDLSGNQIAISVIREAFYGLRKSNLTKLYMLEMALTNLPNDMFEHLRSTPLEGISLHKNNFTLLNGSVFSGLKNLTHIGINNNYISAVDWTGLQNIQVLRMRWNKLPSVPEFCSASNTSFVPNLLVLDLGANKIFDISPQSFRGHCLPRVTNLTLDQNYFRHVLNDTFRDMPSLKRLSLTWVKQDILLFHPLAFRSDSLELLYIANHMGNFFTYHDPHTLFRFCPMLKVLDMTKIRLTTSNGLDVQTLLSPLTNLTKLVLQSTYLYNIPPNLFYKMTKLENLNLELCKISSWPASTFANVTSIKKLYLNKNRISLINQTSFPHEMLENLTFLDLHGNPFTCDCDAFWFRQWIKKHLSILIDFPKSYVCSTPVKWKNRLLVNYDPTYSECHPISPYVILVVSIASALIFIAFIAILLYRYRWHIKHYIYLMRARKGYERIPEGDDFAFDAFVAYNSEDRVWVISKLIPILENQENFKLCLHDRDFEVGKLIVDNIQETIVRSRKVIIVLSNAFAKSQWCKFEMTMAQNRSIEEGGNTVIVVMLEDINARYMSSSLNVLINSTTYIPWSADAQGEELFWKRLLDSVKE